jgi:hypothetical protein
MVLDGRISAEEVGIAVQEDDKWLSLIQNADNRNQLGYNCGPRTTRDGEW